MCGPMGSCDRLKKTMTIDEAIALIEHCAKTHARYDRVVLKDALKLGIEALKEVKKARAGDPALDGDLLPGETGN